MKKMVSLFAVGILSIGISWSVSAALAQTGSHCDTIQAFADGIEAGDFALFERLYTPESVLHVARSEVQTLAERQFSPPIMLARASSDVLWRVDLCIEDADYAGYRISYSGVFDEDMQMRADTFVPATNAPFATTLNGIAKFDDDGMITDEWWGGDSLTLAAQVGLLPPPMLAMLPPLTLATTETSFMLADDFDADAALTSERAADNLAALGAAYDAFNGADAENYLALYSADFAARRSDGTSADKGSIADELETLLAAVPDVQITIEPVVAQGDWVMFRWTVDGTFTGPMAMGERPVAPTNAGVSIPSVTLARFNDAGQIVESWSETDTFTTLRSYGMMPGA